METGLISIYAGGILTLLLALFHTRFYRSFKWEGEYRNITLINRRIFYTIHVALFLTFFLCGSLTLVNARELGRSEGAALGVNMAISGFWLWRALWQIVYFRPPKGRKPPPIWYVMVLWFLLLFMAYLLPAVSVMFR
jgi:hypothetical protein